MYSSRETVQAASAGHPTKDATAGATPEPPVTCHVRAMKRAWMSWVWDVHTQDSSTRHLRHAVA
eukprot:363740-Chlamydomonas_euryale.AAC.11